MPKYYLDPLSLARLRVTEIPIPYELVTFIESSWLGDAKHLLLGVLLLERTDENWTRLGIFLVSALLSRSVYVSLVLDGTCPLDALTSWIAGIINSDDVGCASLSLASTANPITGRIIGAEVQLNLIQPVGAASWMDGLWGAADSQAFHRNCDLLVAGYGVNVVQDLAMEEGGFITAGQIGSTISRALAFLVPLDSNLGFVVGVTEASELHQALETDATERR